jgi:uncharacterized membrane protein
MRMVFIVSFIANMILVAVGLVLCPGKVAIHFGMGGEPDGWASGSVNALIMSGVNILIFVSFFFTSYLIKITPSRWINLPNKEYWLKPENRDKMESKLKPHLWQFGTLTLMLIFIVNALAIQANLSEPVRLREDIFLWSLGLYVAYTIYWCIKTVLTFRIPKDEVR